MKAINHDNWLMADASAKGQTVQANQWREAFLSIRLEPRIPPDVAQLFETARAGLLYGYFFQPLMALGVEQCYRVLESGARVRCAQAGFPVDCVDRAGKSHPLSFSHNLHALAQIGFISDADLSLWQQARELRNWAAKPANQTALTLEHGVTALSRAAELLGRLFRG